MFYSSSKKICLIDSDVMLSVLVKNLYVVSVILLIFQYSISDERIKNIHVRWINIWIEKSIWVYLYFVMKLVTFFLVQRYILMTKVKIDTYFCWELWWIPKESRLFPCDIRQQQLSHNKIWAIYFLFKKDKNLRCIYQKIYLRLR